MRKFTLLFLLIFIVSCNNTGEKTSINIFNSISFRLNQNENEEKINFENKNKYISYLKNSPVQIPLFKIIKGENYIFYIGLPYNTNIQDIIKLTIFGKGNYPQISKSDTITFSYKTYQYNDSYFVEYYEIINKNSFYLLGTTNSKETFYSLFSQKNISERFTKK